MKASRPNTRTFLHVFFALTFAGILLLSSLWAGWHAAAKRVEPGEPAQERTQNAEVSAAADSSEPVAVLVELAEAPTTVVYADKVDGSPLPREAAVAEATAAARAQLARVTRAQDKIGRAH